MIIMDILTFFKGVSVGQDPYGNRYFEERFLFSKPSRPPRRWVRYAGEADPSKIPPEWHSWLHFAAEEPIPFSHERVWQKGHLRNLTGTPWAYRPVALCSKNSTSYQAWTPENPSQTSKDHTCAPM